MTTRGRQQRPGQQREHQGGTRPPQAPRRLSPAVYRRRRIAVGIGVLVVLALLAFALYTVVSLVRAATSASQDVAPKEAPNPTVTLQACEPELLQASLTPEAATIQPGWKLEVKAVFQAAKVRVPCLASGSPDTLGLQITHGDQVVWDSTACTEPAVNKLLFGEDATWETTFTWDGQTHGTTGDCGAVAPAENGVYSLQATYKGTLVGTPAQVTVEGEPPAHG